MRKNRSTLLANESGTVHVYGRCHNRANNFKLSSEKSRYLRCMFHSISKKETHYHGKLSVTAFCVMDNHTHAIKKYIGGSKNLSNHLRNSHSQNAREFNRDHKRSGAFSESRPKTALIQNEYYEMTAHMYIEANPIRAGLCTLEGLKHFRHCSYRFFAFGIVDDFTQHLAIPTWYAELGSTKKQRQAKYRKLFFKYLTETSGGKKSKQKIHRSYIGDALWVDINKKKYCKKISLPEATQSNTC